MGHAVVDEFQTFSTPILIGPGQLLGQLYNTGITLGHQRNPEMPLDQGWPPFCVGIQSDDAVPKGWEEMLLNAIKKTSANLTPSDPSKFRIQHHRNREVEIFATDAPLLPRHLRRICHLSGSPLAIAFSTGNRIMGQKGKLLPIRVISEGDFEQLLHRFSTKISNK